MTSTEPTLADSQKRSAHGHTVSTGRGWILFVAIVQMIIGGGSILFSFFAEDEVTEILIFGSVLLIFGIIFLSLYFWARSNPFPAALTALILYITLVGADAALDPSNAWRGILIKIIIILGLAKAVQSGYAVRKQTPR